MAFNPLPLAADAANAATQIIQSSIRKKEYGKKQREHVRNIQRLKDSRPEIPDYTAEVKDLSGNITNPYENLTVAVKAAEIQMEQSDQALANTLDTIRATGAAAGGATALAQAALQSKKQVAASIEQQEAKNSQLRAQGEMQAQQLELQEKQRYQREMMGAMAAEFQAEEDRINADLDYEANMETRYANLEYQARMDRENQINSAVNEIGTGFVSGEYLGGGITDIGSLAGGM